MKGTKFKRILDLFVEGTECVLGEDETGTDVLIWVSKPNSFEVEEARRDGNAARAIRLMQLTEDSPDVINLRDQLSESDFDGLVGYLVQMNYETDYIGAMDDVDAMEEFREDLDYLQRGEQMLRDAGVPEDDPRWADLTKRSGEYMARLSKRADERQEQRRADLSQEPRADIEAQIVAEYRKRIATDEFIGEKRITELFFALRVCEAEKTAAGWDHSKCDHTVRLADERSEIRGLPENVLKKASAALAAIEVDARTAGNTDAPASSSGSLGQPSAAEASTPSTQEVTPADAPTT